MRGGGVQQLLHSLFIGQAEPTLLALPWLIIHACQLICYRLVHGCYCRLLPATAIPAFQLICYHTWLLSYSRSCLLLPSLPASSPAATPYMAATATPACQLTCYHPVHGCYCCYCLLLPSLPASSPATTPCMAATATSCVLLCTISPATASCSSLASSMSVSSPGRNSSLGTD